MNGLFREISFNGMAPTIVEEVSETLTYIGYLRNLENVSDSVKETKDFWIIKRIEKVGNVTRVKFAEGTQTFTKKWSERANYTYKY